MAESSTRPKFGLDVPIGGDFADAARLAELAADAEAAGWDGFFVMDHLVRRQPWQAMIDPWIALTAVAVATQKISIGPMVTPLARRRTAIIARQTATLDQLCGGRLLLGVGLGAPDGEFTRFGESADPKLRAEILDESLELLQLLWSGEIITYHGEHEHADEVQFLPRPTNGRVPIWVAGGWPSKPPFRRAARYDGIWPISRDRSGLTVDDFLECVAATTKFREQQGDDLSRPFDNCFTSRSPGPGDSQTIDKIGRLTEAGMTWWLEPLDVAELSYEQLQDRVVAGPPG
ncbi:MAG: LLM class flavin-dependent oxidoreductase [Acidimicrobiales bacterium]